MLVKAESNIPEVKELFKSVMAEPERLFEMMEFDMRETGLSTRGIELISKTVL